NFNLEFKDYQPNSFSLKASLSAEVPLSRLSSVECKTGSWKKRKLTIKNLICH
ncbi:hypothetical protein BgiMline_024345, partial [Biomphalaria glabrata]